MTRYHLVSQKARHCEPVRTLAWQSRGASAFLDAVTGATREWLPIDIPAPRPCSAPFLCPFSAAGVLCASICAYSSLHRLFWDCTAYYSHKPPDLSTIICPSCKPPPQPRKNAAETGGTDISLHPSPKSALLLSHSMLYCSQAVSVPPSCTIPIRYSLPLSGTFADATHTP